MTRKLTTEEFIRKAKLVHGDLYDYSKVVYVNIRTSIIITDPIYGDFEQLPGSHLQGYGNIKRGNVLKSKKTRYTKEQFIEKANKVHNNFYDYSKVNYINSQTKVIIIDPEYGDFEQTPAHHLNGYGSQKRGGNKKLTTEEFIEKAKLIHGNLYDYSKVNYIDAHTNVIIIDPVYGEFEQMPYCHLQGRGSIKRAIQKQIKRQSSTTSEFIEKAIKVHGDLYDYSKLVYINRNTKVIIIDSKFGEFEQTPCGHLSGQGHPLRGKLKSSSKRKLTTEKFIKKARLVHGDLYDYSKVVFTCL